MVGRVDGTVCGLGYQLSPLRLLPFPAPHTGIMVTAHYTPGFSSPAHTGCSLLLITPQLPVYALLLFTSSLLTHFPSPSLVATTLHPLPLSIICAILFTPNTPTLCLTFPAPLSSPHALHSALLSFYPLHTYFLNILNLNFQNFNLLCVCCTIPK